MSVKRSFWNAMPKWWRAWSKGLGRRSLRIKTIWKQGILSSLLVLFLVISFVNFRCLAKRYFPVNPKLTWKQPVPRVFTSFLRKPQKRFAVCVENLRRRNCTQVGMAEWNDSFRKFPTTLQGTQNSKILFQKIFVPFDSSPNITRILSWMESVL